MRFSKSILQVFGDEWRSGLAGCGAAQSRTDARHQLFDAEGFDDVVVGAGIESLYFIAFGIAHGEHDDGRIAGGANFAAGFEAGNSGQIHVEKNQLGPHAADFFESFFAAANFDDGIALRREGGEHNAADLRFIVHNENGGGVHQSLDRPRSVGKVKEKTEPWPRWLVRVMVPPWASMMALAMGKAHAGALHEVALILATIKFFEDEGLLEVVNAGAAVGDAGDDEIAGRFRGDGDGLGRGRILIGVLEQMDKSLAGAGEIHANATAIPGCTFTLHDAIAESALALGKRGGDNVFDRARFELEFDFTGVQARHFTGFADQAIQAIGFFIDDGEKFLALAVGDAGVREQVGDGGLDGSERGAQRVGDGIEQRGAQAFAFAGRFGEAELLDGAGAFDGDGDQGADGFEGLARKHRAGNAEAADGTAAQTHRDEGETIGHVQDRLFAQHDGIEAFEIEFGDDRAGAVDFLFFGEQQGGGADFENVHDLRRNAVEQLNHVAGFQQAPG